MKRSERTLCVSLAVFFLLLPTVALSAPHYATAPGMPRIAYSDSGAGGVPVLLVHGWSCDGSFWSRQTEALSKHHRVIVMDLPGHGQSSAPRIAYSRDLFVDSVSLVLDRLRITRAVLAGHSLGWDVIRAFALRSPERVAALVNVDGAYCRVPRTPEERAALEKLFAGFGAPFADTNPESIDKARASFIDMLFAQETPEPMRNWIRSRMSATPPHVARSAMLEFLRLERWTDARPVQVPTLAVYAEFTARQELPGHREYLRALNPELEYEEWPGSGHFVMTEDADRLNRRLLAFLESIR